MNFEFELCKKSESKNVNQSFSLKSESPKSKVTFFETLRLLTFD